MNQAGQQLDAVRLAARLYYVDNASQVEIARVLEISQAKVSRLLQTARDKGIVRISVDEYEPRRADLEAALCQTFGLCQAAVIGNLSDVGIAGVRRNVGYFGAPVLSEMIRPGQVVGLTGGRAVAEIVRQVNTPRTVRDLRIVPLMGSIGAAVNANDPIELSRHLSDATGGTYYALNTPAFVSSAASRLAFRAQVQVKMIWKLYDELDIAVVGIGTLHESAFVDRGALSDEDLRRLRRAGAIGEICGRFYDDQGDACETDYCKRVVSIELDKLRRIPHVVGVTAGENRAEAVLVALWARLVNALIVDESCARKVLQLASEQTQTVSNGRTKLRNGR